MLLPPMTQVPEALVTCSACGPGILPLGLRTIPLGIPTLLRIHLEETTSPPMQVCFNMCFLIHLFCHSSYNGRISHCHYKKQVERTRRMPQMSAVILASGAVSVPDAIAQQNQAVVLVAIHDPPTLLMNTQLREIKND